VLDMPSPGKSGQPGNSLLMAMGFIIAITSYATAAHRSQ
jgi:hypothetical protein